MAKKKLTPYEQARRQFVQARVEQRGITGTPEERKQIRQRFDVLAQTKQGRTKIAQRALPNANPEERRDFKRTLATELPARKMGGTSNTSSTSSTPLSYSQSVTQAWQGAVKSGSYKVPTPPKKTAVTKTSTTSTSTPKTTVGSAFKNRRNNIIGQGINYPGRTAIEGFLNPLGGKGPIKDFSAGGLAKAAAQEFGEAAIAVGSTRPLSAVARKATGVVRFGLRNLGKLLPQTKQSGTNQFGGVGKTPYGPTKDNLSPLALNPGPKSNLSKTDFESLSSQIDDYQSTLGNLKSATKAPTRGKTPAGTKAPSVRFNKQGGVGSQKYGPAAPAKTATTKPATTKPATTKPATTKPATTKPATTRAASTKGADSKPLKPSDDIPLNFPSTYRYATEADKPFLQQLNRAQQAIESNAPTAKNYATWLKNPKTQATLRRLKTGK